MKNYLFLILLGFALTLNIRPARAQYSNVYQIGQQSFNILRNIQSMNKYDYYNSFSSAISIIGQVHAPIEVYNQMYETILESGFEFNNIQFVEFNGCSADWMEIDASMPNVSCCSASTLVFEYYGNKYYIKVIYFLYNNRYYLLGFRDREIKNYPQ